MSRYNSDCKVYVGDLGNSASKQEIEDAFRHYGPLRNVWVARNPPGFAFVEFEDPRDAEDAVRGLAEDRRPDQEVVRFIQMIGAMSVETAVTTQGTVESTEEEDVVIELEADPEVVLAIEELAPEAIRAHAAGPGRVDPDQLLRRVEAAPDPTGMIGDPGRALTPGAGRP
ncbi:hypothetical protein D910_06427 [Dendroctonus ponderosae]|uniref:RRM domain-containing protein n=1 Tax=Dendroctonus ponderosae TaxID=77166 RepID=U4U584_DENPD|nr:hypothetical protein D910_06427 [Dendroctonus ponderosae]